VAKALADATGRTDEELNLGLAVAVAAAGLIAALRLLNWLQDLGVINVGHSRREPDPTRRLEPLRQRQHRH
jgi:hypothetical protein